MIVALNASEGSVRLDSADDFQHFHVQAPVGIDPTRVDGIEPTGEPDNVWVSVKALRHWPADRPTNWSADFDAMVRMAKSAGWLSPDGTHIRAHIEPPT